MQNVIAPTNIPNYVVPAYYTVTKKKSQVSVFSKFIAWCQGQEEYRMLWMALAFLGLIGVAMPLTLVGVVFLAGNNLGLWIAVCIINVPVLVVNLAAQPTKITLPFLFFAWIMDAAIIIYCVSYFFIHWN